jgi:hypothetical protein
MKGLRRLGPAGTGTHTQTRDSSEEGRREPPGSRRDWAGALPSARTTGVPAAPEPEDEAAHHDHAEIDVGIALLVEALNQVGATTEASCEGHLRRLSTGERCRPCLPYVVFRSNGSLVTFVLEIARELYYRPPDDGFLHALWYVESCPALEGGVLHTLTPHPSFAPDGVGRAELAAAQQDARTLATFLLRRQRATARHGWRGLAPSRSEG